MEVVILAQGLPFGPTTIEHRSLGGSETAALMMARELRKRGHLVSIFCNLPPVGYPDHIENGAQDDLGVRWVSGDQYQGFISNTEVDLLVVSRNPDLFQCVHQAKKAVLWCHDLATYQGLLPRLMQSAWNFDEIWCVSEYHRQQIHKVTGYPLKNIRATRNGIVKFDSILQLPREEKTLLYSARPERGLENLVKEGGIMERLPEYHLYVTMYENYPDHMMDYYRYLWSRCEALDNVTLLGPKTQLELRQLMRKCWAYCYPTAFEEVSCIIARECIEQKLPFIGTTIGALPETLNGCGHLFECTKEEVGTEKFCEEFAEFVKGAGREIMSIEEACSLRNDLYWDDVAEQWEEWSVPEKPTDYSAIHSLIQDSDIIAAKAVLDTIPEDKRTPGIKWLENELKTKYEFVFGNKKMEDHYKDIYDFEESKQVPERQSMKTLRGHARYNCIAQLAQNVLPGSTVIEYGCAEGPIILQLARDFPDRHFIGIDFVEANIDLCKKYAKEHDINNVSFYTGSVDDWPAEVEEVDAAIIAEVLEHTIKPWEIISKLESHVKIGGRMILTVPQGPWEWQGLKGPQWPWRAHIWHINKWMLRKMFENKEECILNALQEGYHYDGRVCGHLVMGYKADGEPAVEIDPIEKARLSRYRQSMAACMIAMNDDATIIRALDSIGNFIEQLQIALGPSTDHTRERIEEWASEHPWVETRIIDVPKIEAKKFGFDDARNESIKNIESDWILWIDCDEYLSGDKIRVFTRNHCFDSLAIQQHHFTCEPAGAPAQIDKPARLFRNRIGFEFFGKVHEHAELGFNGGPGFVLLVPGVDIGHTGYVNDATRMSRFGRNFPLLEWDQEVYPERKLGRFLWLRDIIHRMRLINQQGNVNEARRLAEEAINFFKEFGESFEAIGGGSNATLAYVSEAMQFLGRGWPMIVAVQLEEQTAQYQGVFESEEDAFKIAKRALKEQIEKRKSGYWQ